MGDDEQYQSETGVVASRRGSMLPWVLFVLALLLGVFLVVVLKARLDAEESKASTATQKAEEYRTHSASLEGEKKALEARVAELEKERTAIAAERDVLADKLKAGAGAKAAQAKAPPPAAKKKGKKHHR